MNAPVAGLVRYDSMCRAIDAAFDVDEVKDIRDKALALEAYSKQARNTDAERKACEIRLRAERKAGLLLSTMEKAKGAPGNQHTGKLDRSRDETGPKTLSDLGISKNQSHRWQQLAAVPEEQFEAALAEPVKPTTSGIIARAAPPVKPIDERALWIWGRLRDFERDGLLAANPRELLDEMTDAMRADVLRLAPLVAGWIERLSDG